MKTHLSLASTRRSAGLVAVCFCLFSATLAGKTQAQATNTFDFGVGAEAGMLATDDADMLLFLMKRAMWQFGPFVDYAFENPAFEITNDASSDDVIVGLKITIGDPDYNFTAVEGSSDLVYSPNMMDLPTGLSTSVTDFDGSSASAGDADANVLSLDLSGLLNGGLLPGESLMFKATLGADDPNAGKASFDQVLFGLDNDTSNNALICVTFEDPTTGMQTVLEQRLEDLTFFDLSLAEHLGEFKYFNTVQLSATGTVIPEPATASLLALCLAAGACSRHRRRSVA